MSRQSRKEAFELGCQLANVVTLAAALASAFLSVWWYLLAGPALIAHLVFAILFLRASEAEGREGAAREEEARKAALLARLGQSAP